MNTKPTSFLVFANGSIEHAEVCIEDFIQPKKKIEFFFISKVNDFDDLYLRFSYVIGKDWEICSVDFFLDILSLNK